jgi:hypothetical protein
MAHLQSLARTDCGRGRLEHRAAPDSTITTLATRGCKGNTRPATGGLAERAFFSSMTRLRQRLRS